MNRLALSCLGFVLILQLANSAYADAVKLTWDPSPDAGVAGYRVYRSEQKGVFTSSPLNGSTLVTTTSWNDSSATNNHTYYYVVRTVNTKTVESSNSNEISIAPFFAHINFQAPGTTYPGYVADVGAAFGNRGNGFTYGWSQDNTIVSPNTGPRSRGDSTSPDQRYDTLVHMGALNWEIAVPNGTYSVHAVVGDPSYADVVSKLTFEGTLAINGSTSSSARWLQGTATVTVNDGRLTISNLSGSYNKISFIDIASITFVNQAPPGFSTHIDFQAPGTTYPGYVADVGAAFGNRGNGFTYGWSQDNTIVSPNTGPRSRGDSTSPDQRYDTLVHMGALNWEIAVPNGTYSVHAVVGDPSYADVVSKLTVEGTLTINGSTSSSARWLQGTATVSVTDGRLTISNLSGSYNKICFIDIASTTTANQTTSVSVGPAIADMVQPIPHKISNSISFSDSNLPLIQNGRVSAEIQGPVNTAITIDNPNTESVTLDFYFTDADGNELYSSRTLIPGNRQISGLLSDLPFAPPPEISLGTARTFTFFASAPISVTAERGFTNERSEFLMTPLPVAELNSASGLPMAFPYDITGEAWDTEIQLVNTSNSVLSGVMSFFPAEDPSISASDSLYEIAPRSGFTLQIPQTGSGPRVGWIRLTPSDGTPAPSGILILSLHEGDITVSQTGIYLVSDDSTVTGFEGRAIIQP